MPAVTTPADRLRKALHDLSLYGAKTPDERAALGRLSYYLTGTTAEKIAKAVLDGDG